MAVFATHVVLMRDFQAVAFAPGDELPEWAEGKVGDHCLVPDVDDADADIQDAAPDASDNDQDDDQDDAPDLDSTDSGDVTAVPAIDVPDFTAPAPARRGSRTRR